MQSLSGPMYVLKGLQLMFSPGFRRYVIGPLLVNLIVFIGIWFLGVHFFHQFVAWSDRHLPDWLQWLNVLLWLIYGLTMLLISGYLFTWVANLIAAPFYGLLSERTQKHLKGQPLPEVSWMEVIADAPKAIGRELQKLAYALPRAVGLLILSLIPVINIVSGVLWFVFGAWMQMLQYIDYPLDNNRISFVGVKTFMRAHRGLSLSFGATVMLLMMIPVVNIVVMPAAVVGATCLYVDLSE